MVNLTAPETRLLRELVNWALDQDHDAIEPDYLYFLAEEETPSIEDCDRVRQLLRGLDDKLLL